MDNWLKGLIAGACVVVIAFGGLFVFRAYEGYRGKQAIADYQAGCVRTAVDLAKYIRTESATDDAAAEMTRKVRSCMAALRGTGFAEVAENIVRGSGYTLTGSPLMLPLIDN